MSKSKKIQNSIIGGDGLQTTLNNGRWVRAWRELETGMYILEAGNDMMPRDYSEEHETVEALEASMREVANLRKWGTAQY